MIQQSNGRIVYERADCPLVNTPEHISGEGTRYIVKIWDGHGYTCHGFLAWAASEENALVEVVNYIRHCDLKKKLCIRKQELYRLFQQLEDDGYDAYDAQFLINQYAHFVNGRPWYKFKEYIREENLQILEADEAHYNWYD